MLFLVKALLSWASLSVRRRLGAQLSPFTQPFTWKAKKAHDLAKRAKRRELFFPPFCLGTTLLLGTLILSSSLQLSHLRFIETFRIKYIKDKIIKVLFCSWFCQFWLHKRWQANLWSYLRHWWLITQERFYKEMFHWWAFGIQLK